MVLCTSYFATKEHNTLYAIKKKQWFLLNKAGISHALSAPYLPIYGLFGVPLGLESGGKEKEKVTEEGYPRMILQVFLSFSTLTFPSFQVPVSSCVLHQE